MRNLGALFGSFQLDEEFEDTYDKETNFINSNPKTNNEVEEQVPILILRPQEPKN